MSKFFGESRKGQNCGKIWRWGAETDRQTNPIFNSNSCHYILVRMTRTLWDMSWKNRWNLEKPLHFQRNFQLCFQSDCFPRGGSWVDVNCERKLFKGHPQSTWSLFKGYPNNIWHCDSGRTMTAFIVKHVEKSMFRTIPIALNLTWFFIIHNFVCDLSSAQQKRWELSSPRRKLEEGIASPFAYWLLLMGWRPLRLGGGGGMGEGWGAGNLHRWPTCTATMLAPWALGGGLSIVM